MGSFTHIDHEDMWKNKFKFVDGGAYSGPGWYNKDTGLKDEPSSKSLEAPSTSAGIISGRPLKPPGEFNSLLKEIKKKTLGTGINIY
jgi:hypothetical protein